MTIRMITIPTHTTTTVIRTITITAMTMITK